MNQNKMLEAQRSYRMGSMGAPMVNRMQAPYGPADFAVDAAWKFIGQPLYNIASGNLMRAVSAPRDEVPMDDSQNAMLRAQELNRSNAAGALGAGMEAGGLAALGSFGAKAPAGALRSGPARPDAGLDMSQAARLQRAREMGFDTDTTLYHGTHSNKITEFDNSKIGSSNDGGFYGAGHYFTPHKGEARYYGPNVDDYYTRGKMLDLSNDTGDYSYLGHFKSFAPKLKKIGALDENQTQALDDVLRAEKYVDDNATYIQHQNLDGSDGWSIRVPNPADGYSQPIRMMGDRGKYPATKEEALEMMKYQFKGEMERFHQDVYPYLGKESASLSDYIRADSNIGSSGLTDRARAAGYDGIIYGDERVIFDPSNIRSVNAAFDPAKSGSANLLAANPFTGAVVPSYAAPRRDERR